MIASDLLDDLRGSTEVEVGPASFVGSRRQARVREHGARYGYWRAGSVRTSGLGYALGGVERLCSDANR